MKLFIMLLIFSGKAFGHGGGLDSEECHNDNVGTEGFHCHLIAVSIISNHVR